MPAKNNTRTPAHKIKAAVMRYLAGEPVSALAREHKMSRPGFYLWIAKYKEELVEKAKTINMTAAGKEKSVEMDLRIENTGLKAENKKLKQKLFELMLATDRI